MTDKPRQYSADEVEAAHHPFIAGLFQALPDPGSPWPNNMRGAWLDAAASCFNLMYKDDGPTVRPKEPPHDKYPPHIPRR